MMKKEITFKPLPNNNLFLLAELENPAELMHNAIADVTDAFEVLYNDYNMSYDEFYTYIQFHNHDLSQEIDELWNTIDCDVYDHYEQGTLLSFEFINWKTTLLEWTEKTMAAIRDIVKAEYHDEFRTGSSHIAYFEAA